MADFNDVFCEGRITKDSSREVMPNGVSVVQFCIAINEDRRLNDGTWDKHVHFVDVYLYGSYAESLWPSLLKSQKVIVRGKIEQQRWMRNGEEVSKLIVVAHKVRVLGSTRKIEPTTED